MTSFVALNMLFLSCPPVQPPVAPRPIPRVVMGQVNHGRKGTLTARLLRYVTDETMRTLVRAVPKLGDFLGPEPWNSMSVRWDRKLTALLDLQQGNDKEYKLALHKIAQKRDEAKDRSARFAKDAAGIVKYLRNPGLRPDTVRGWSDTLASAKRAEAWWQTMHEAKSKELEALEAMGQAVIKARMAKRAPSP